MGDGGAGLVGRFNIYRRFRVERPLNSGCANFIAEVPFRTRVFGPDLVFGTVLTRTTCGHNISTLTR